MEYRRGEIYIRRDRDTGFVDADASADQLFEPSSPATIGVAIDNTAEREINPVCFGDVEGEQIVDVTDLSADFQDISLGDGRHFVLGSDTATGGVPIVSDAQNVVSEAQEPVSQIESSQTGWRSVLSGLGRYVWQTPVSQEPVNQNPSVSQGGGARPKTVSRTSVAQSAAVRQNTSPADAVSQLSDNQNVSVRQTTVSQNRPAAAVSRNPQNQALASTAVSENLMRPISDMQTPVTVRRPPPRGSQLGHINHVHLTSLVNSPADVPATPVYVLANPSVTQANAPIMPTYVPSVQTNSPDNAANSVYPTFAATIPVTAPASTVVLTQPVSQIIPATVGGRDTCVFPVPVLAPSLGVEGERQSPASVGTSLLSQPGSGTTAVASQCTVQSVPSDSRRSTVIKTDKYDGTTPLETFVAKFDNTASYCKWSESDRLYHLKASLIGQAGEVLWGLTPETTEKEIFELLRNRYGNVNQTERFRAELDARRRQPGETVQDVYNDIRRLLALAFPKQAGEMVEFLGRAAFLKALNDPQLTMRVMDQQPKTLDDTLATVCRMLSYTVPASSPGGSSAGGLTNERKKCHAVGAGGRDTSPSVNNQLQRLERELAEQRRQVHQLQQELDQWRTEPEPGAGAYQPQTPPCPPVQSQVYTPSQPTYQPQWANPAPAGVPTSSSQQQRQQPPPRYQHGRGRVRGRGGSQRNHIDYDTCRLCHGKNHWAWQCPSNPRNLPTVDGGNAEANQNTINQQSHASGVSNPNIGSETYLDIFMAGVKVSCLIDTGSDHCLMPRNRVQNANLTPVNVDLYAANGTRIPVLGTVRMGFKLLNSPTPLYADFLVSDSVDEVMLGFNWLRENNCQWLFDRAILVVAGRPTKLRYRPSRTNVRRIYARERVVILPNSSATVPVRMPFSNLHAPVSEWTAEPKQIRSGLIVGRTIVSHDDTFAAMHIINLSGNCHVLKRNYLLGEAQPGIVCGEVDCSSYVDGHKAINLEDGDDADGAPVEATAGNTASEISVGTGNTGQTSGRYSDDADGAAVSGISNIPAADNTAPQQRFISTAELSLGSVANKSAHSGQNVSRTSDGVRTDISYEAKAINLDNSARFHFSQSCDPIPYSAEFTPPAISCEIEFRHPSIIADEARGKFDFESPASSREREFSSLPQTVTGNNVFRSPSCDFSSLPHAVRRNDEFQSPPGTWLGSEAINRVQDGTVPIATELEHSAPRDVPTQLCGDAAILRSQTARLIVPTQWDVPISCDQPDTPSESLSLSVGRGDENFVKLWSPSCSSYGFARSVRKRGRNAVDSSVLSSTTVPTSECGEFTCDNSHIDPVIATLPDDLTIDERDRAVQLLTANADIFSRHEFDYGRTGLLTFSIDTGDHRPIAQPLRRHPRAYLDLIDETVNKLLQAKVIEPAASPWNFNVVLVAKPNNPIPRVTIDYRALNAITYKDHFPLPKIRECLDTLSGSIYFSTLDLSGSFFQLGLKESDRDKTAFSTRMGQWKFTTMPMGSCNSPSFFSRLMSVALRGLTYSKCLVFIDDSIVIGRTFDEHLANLHEVFDRFRQAKLKLKPTKCKVFQRRVKFLGHIVSKEGVEVDPDKTACIDAWEFPKNVTEVRQFLGICGYYRSFCEHYATKAAPLQEMTRRDVPVKPTPERLRAFAELKQMLTSAPVLAMPIDDGQYYLDVDCSDVGAGAILGQVQDGKVKVIEYASRTLNKAERTYCSTRKETLALIFGLKHFRTYLLGQRFVCRTDHMALTYFRDTPEPVGQQARFLSYAAEFDMDLQYRPGSRHANCDALSRLRPCEIENGGPCRQCHRRVIGKHVRTVTTRSQQRAMGDNPDSDAQNVNEPVIGQEGGPEATPPQAESKQTRKKQTRPKKQKKEGWLHRSAPNAANNYVSEWDLAYFAEQQRSDPDIGPAMSWIDNNERPDWETIKGASPALRALYQQYESLLMIDNVLYRSFYDSNGSILYNQLVLPSNLRHDFLELVHGDVAGHLRYRKCIDHVQRRAYWFRWKTDLDLFIKCCSRCAAYHRGKTPKQSQLHPQILGAPNERWVLDLCGPFKPSNGYKYIFTAVDPFSKYVIAVPIRNKEAKTVAKVIMDHIILVWGHPFEILTDQGLEFNSELSGELYRLLGVNKIRSTAYRPETQGTIERWHGTLHSMMAKVVSENQSDWPNCLKHVTFCYNSTCHSSTSLEPHFVMTGQRPRCNVDMLLGDRPHDSYTVPEYTQELVGRLHRMYELVRVHLNRSATYASNWYNRIAKPVTFQEGDEVHVYSPRRYKGRTPKWALPYKDTGTILQRLNEVTYRVKCKGWRTPRVIHVDKLKLVKHFPAPEGGETPNLRRN